MPDQFQAPMMVGTATVFIVRDVAASIVFYRDVLGFKVTFEFGKPTYYVCLSRDEAALHLMDAKRSPQPPGHGALCVFVRNVDAVHAEFTRSGAKPPKPPQDYAYGMRDFDVFDPDGNRMTIGAMSQKSS